MHGLWKSQRRRRRVESSGIVLSTSRIALVVTFVGKSQFFQAVGRCPRGRFVKRQRNVHIHSESKAMSYLSTNSGFVFFFVKLFSHILFFSFFLLFPLPFDAFFCVCENSIHFQNGKRFLFFFHFYISFTFLDSRIIQSPNWNSWKSNDFVTVFSRVISKCHSKSFTLSLSLCFFFPSFSHSSIDERKFSIISSFFLLHYFTSESVRSER